MHINNFLTVSINTETETLDLFNILSKICIDKTERNRIIESIDKLYGKNARIEGVGYFEKDSIYSFDEISGKVIEEKFGPKRRIDFTLYKSFYF